MRHILLAAMTLVTGTAVMPLRAQEQIEKLYQRMASDPKVEVSQNIQVDRQPNADVKGKTSVCEINSFTIRKANKKGRYKYAEYGRNYVTDIAAAIQAEASNPDCYRIASYSPNGLRQDPPREWNLLYGNQATQYITIGKQRGKSYIFACFTDKQNPDYRWCYALEWFDWDKDVLGRYMKLYAKIPEEQPSVQSMVIDTVVYHGSLDYGLEDPFGGFNLDNKLSVLGITIDGQERTFTLNGKKLPLDSLSSAMGDGPGAERLEAELQTGVLANIIKKNTANRTQRFLSSFNALRAQWMKGDYLVNPALPVSLYTLVKDAVEADILTAGERELVREQLQRLVDATDSSDDPAAADYLRLAQKVLSSAK